jgi:hypothetical protein
MSISMVLCIKVVKPARSGMFQHLKAVRLYFPDIYPRLRGPIAEDYPSADESILFIFRYNISSRRPNTNVIKWLNNQNNPYPGETNITAKRKRKDLLSNRI